jgi:glycosyltransferase involved in cell wall biosynthesis
MTPSSAVLMVFPWCVDRVGHGNVQRMLAIASHLSRQGFDVDLVYQGNPRVPSREHELTGFRRVVRVSAWESADALRIHDEWEAFYAGYEPPPANLAAGTALTSAVRGLLDTGEYSATIATYAWTAPILARVPPRVLRIVDLQDVIALHAERAHAATGTMPAFSMAVETERFLWRQWDVLLAITPDEAQAIAPFLRPSQRLLTVPHAVPVTDCGKGDGGTIAYTGSDNPSNQAAVSWLLTEVWPRVLAVRPHARLRLVGLICDAIRRTSLTATPNVDLVGFVDRPMDEVAKASICVAPYLYGSGLKIKVIEAAGAGRAIVTTPAGAEGTGFVDGAHALIAQDSAAFASAIVRLLGDEALRRRLAAAARDHARQHFSDEACYGTLVDLLRAPDSPVAVTGIIPRAVEQRLRTVLAALDSPTVVVWGNGSHTRALLPVLSALGARVRGIVDKSAAIDGMSPERIAVVPAKAFAPRPDDLIVLSSQAYEWDMWEDLAPIRAAGAHALALYCRELITAGLARIVRGGTPRPLSSHPATLRVAPTRLVIVEPSAGRGNGPFLRLARSLHDVSLGTLRVVVAGARRISPDGLESTDRELLEPAFDFTYLDALREIREDTWRGVARFSRLQALDLARLSDRLTLASPDVVLFHSTTLLDVFGAAQWMTTRLDRDVPEIRFLFHVALEQGARWLNASADAVRHAYAVALALLDDRADGRVRLLAQNDALAERLARAFDRPVDVMGFPVPSRPRPVSGLTPARPPRLLYAGEARAEKGFGLLPAMADVLGPELRDGRLRIVCQSTRNEIDDARVETAARALAARPGVELIDRFLPSNEYDALVAGCDLVLLPYDAAEYRARLSAVFVDATCAGVPVIVPEGTWMSGQIADGAGAGWTFASLDAAAIADLVRGALASLPSMQDAARRASERAWQRHDPRAVLETILRSQDVTAEKRIKSA